MVCLMVWSLKTFFILMCIFNTHLLSSEYFTDLEGRPDQDPSLQWDFYSSSVFGRRH